ncbi:MAG TPA: acyl carrier protein [Sphingobium sp.]|jgi:acyl carrier protein|nr:acyl carrier protein [Sphingobium sp.]
MNEMSPSFEPAVPAGAFTRDALRTRIAALFDEMWREDHDSDPPPLEDDTVLLETGFDSMAFAVLVARLDDELGFDPFTMTEDPVYPQTFSEFLDFYEKCAPRPQ